MYNSDLQLAWHAVYTKSRHESVLFDNLCGKSIEAFLPKVLKKSTRRDRKKMIRAPLFPGYLFVRSRMTAHDHVEILKTKGAVYVIGGSHGPLHIPDETIESLKIISGTEKVVTGNQFRHGDSVVVMAGPFEGVYGIFTRYKGTDRVVVHIEALGQFAAVEIDVNDVEAVNPALSCDTKREAVAAGLALG